MYVEIKTNRLLLRPLGINDLYTTHEYASDIKNTRYMLMLPNHTLEETRQFLAWVMSEWEKDMPTTYEFAIVLDDRHIGAISIRLDEQRREGELGWILDKRFWRKGYATEAALAIKQYAIDTLRVKKLLAHCDNENHESEKLMQRIGMHLEAEAEKGTRQYPDARGTSGEYTYALYVDNV